MAFSWPTSASDAENALNVEALRRQVPVPAIWLFGKTGSGKTSVIRFLTGAEAATIGEGYRPETRTARRYDFPEVAEPLVTFLDTRGLSEASYDPSEDIGRFSESSQLMIVTVRVADHALDSLLAPLRRIRKASPDRPVLLVLTCLHQVTGELDLSAGPDPFAQNTSDEIADAAAIPPALQTLIQEKRNQFAGLVDDVIPVDLTQLEDGFADPDFGGTRLQQAILDRLPQAYRQALLALHQVTGTAANERQRRSRRLVLASSAMAATAGAVPLPWLDIPVVLGIQAHLAVKIAKIYEQEITPARWAVISSAAGGRIAARFVLREVLKFIPLVGMAIGAASSFALTYAMGMSWDWYFADLRHGNVPTPEQLKEIFAEQLARGHELWKAK